MIPSFPFTDKMFKAACLKMDYDINVGCDNILSNLQLEHNNSIYRKHNGLYIFNICQFIFWSKKMLLKWWRHYMSLVLCEDNPLFTAVFPSQRINDAKLWYFYWYKPIQTVDKLSICQWLEMQWLSSDITVVIEVPWEYHRLFVLNSMWSILTNVLIGCYL